jgi:hypothetical protein
MVRTANVFFCNDRSFKRDFPGARVGQIEDEFLYHLQDADVTDKIVVSYIPNVAVSSNAKTR